MMMSHIKLQYGYIFITWNEHFSTMGGLPGELSEELVTSEKRKRGCGMNCDIAEATEWLENEL